MTYQTLEILRQGPRATLWLNRPDVRNAFNETSIAEITQAFRMLDKDRTVRVIVLAARGTAFCAGADLNWMKKMASYSEEENLADAQALAEMMQVIYECNKPTIARVQGDCYAGGMGLVAACDMALVVDTAGFCLSEVRLGGRHRRILFVGSASGFDSGDYFTLCHSCHRRARLAPLLSHCRAFRCARGSPHRSRA